MRFQLGWLVTTNKVITAVNCYVVLRPYLHFQRPYKHPMRGPWKGEQRIQDPSLLTRPHLHPSSATGTLQMQLYLTQSAT